MLHDLLNRLLAIAPNLKTKNVWMRENFGWKRGTLRSYWVRGSGFESDWLMPAGSSILLLLALFLSSTFSSFSLSLFGQAHTFALMHLRPRTSALEHTTTSIANSSSSLRNLLAIFQREDDVHLLPVHSWRGAWTFTHKLEQFPDAVGSGLRIRKRQYDVLAFARHVIADVYGVFVAAAQHVCSYMGFNICSKKKRFWPSPARITGNSGIFTSVWFVFHAVLNTSNHGFSSKFLRGILKSYANK